jgi:hypothetical protein
MEELDEKCVAIPPDRMGFMYTSKELLLMSLFLWIL